MQGSAIEPWLRGPIEGIPALLMPLFFTFAQVREDIRTHTADLTEHQVWTRVANNPPLGFHMRHIAGSIDRLLTYLEERTLTDEQLLFLRREGEPGMGLPELVRDLEERLSKAETRLRQIVLPDLFAPRYVGRKRLVVTALGLLVHIAEHTQRHLGQAITTAKAVRDL
jgi:hypothetical protein